MAKGSNASRAQVSDPTVTTAVPAASLTPQIMLKATSRGRLDVFYKMWNKDVAAAADMALQQTTLP